MLAVSSLPFDDVQQICIVLAILYVAECCWWLRGNAYRLHTYPFTGWSEVPADAPRVDAWRFGIANPLPWAESFASESFPFPFDAESLLVSVFDPVMGSERYEALSFDEIEPVVASERDVLIGARRVGSFFSEAFARSTASRLERLRSARGGDRQRVAESIVGDIWDVSAARSRLAAWRSNTRFLRHWGGALTMLGLVAVPLAWTCRQWLPPSALIALGVACACAWFVTAFMGLRMGNSMLPHDGGGGVHRALAFVSPVNAMRLYDTLGRDVMVEYEPLAVLLGAGAGRQANGVLSSFLRDVLFPAGGPTRIASSAASQVTVDGTLAWFCGRMKFHARQAVLESGLDPDGLLEQDAVEQGARTYCPRCARQFILAEGECGACCLPLLAFDATARSRCHRTPAGVTPSRGPVRGRPAR